jgi:hypothetical protein
MEFPLTLWFEKFLQNIQPPLLFSKNTTPWMLCSTMEQVQYKIMEPILLLMDQHLTEPNNHLGLGF